VFEYLTRRLKYFLILILSELFYIGGLSRSVYSGDAGDLVSAAVTCGIPHPPGYPLYTFFGCILTRFNLLTPAYRVGLLSAIPAGISLLVIFVILEKITKNFWISVISICTLSFTYLFWLYSIVPEVFGLNTLFITLLIYISLLILDKPTKRRFYALALVFGLSLSHHHTILFLSPALLYIIYKSRKALRTYGHNFYIIFPALFFLGLIPYTYLPIAAWGNPKINWNDPRNLNNFVALVTRADPIPWFRIIRDRTYHFGSHWPVSDKDKNFLLQFSCNCFSWSYFSFLCLISPGLKFWRRNFRKIPYSYIPVSSSLDGYRDVFYQ